MARKNYIAYGSNLNIDQMLMRCPTARVLGTSEIPDYELLYKGSKTGSYLTIEPKEGGQVPVAIWSVTEEDEQALDRYEGCPTFYYKTEMRLPVRSIRTGKVRNMTCFVYIMHEDRHVGLPTLTYVNTCLEGYRAFGFDRTLLYQAVRNRGRNCNEG